MSLNYEIIGFLDNFKTGYFLGKRIFSPLETKDFKFDEIIICSMFYDEIITQLRELGITKYSLISEINNVNKFKEEFDSYNSFKVKTILVNGNYNDNFGNRIFSTGKYPTNIKVTFYGKNNTLYLDKTSGNIKIEFKQQEYLQK